MSQLPPNNTGVTRFAVGTAAATFPSSPISFQGNAAWTIELWFSLDAMVDSMPLVSKGAEFLLASKGASLYAALGGQTVPLQSQPVLATGVPYCVCVVYDGLNMSLYLCGALLAQATCNANPPITTTPLTIGNGFYGEIQGVRLWNAATNANILGQNQFNEFPAGTPSLAAQIDFTVSPPVDSSGHSLVPNLSAGTVYAPFVPAGELSTNSFCAPYNDGAVNPAGAQQPFSVAAWICPDTTTRTMYIFTNGVQESNSGMTLGLNDSGQLFMQVGSSTILTSTSALAPGVWVYVAATWTAPTGTLYVNGALDCSGNGMVLDGALASGEPLIGAIASVGAELPISSFEGQVQSVCVWNVALTAAQVAAYSTASPQSDPTCVAYYDLSQPPAQNQISFNPLGLVAGAALAPVPLYHTRQAQSQRSRFADATPESLRPAPRLPSAEGDADTFSAAVEAEFESVLDLFDIDDTQRDFFRTLHATRLQEGQRAFLAGEDHAARVRIETIDGGLARMTYLHPDGTTEVISEAEFDACTLWCIQLVVAVVGALWLALGLAFNYPRFLTGMTNFFGTRINTIGFMPQFTALFNNGVTSQGIYAALKLLHEYSLLTSIAKLSYQLVFSALSWWTILSIGIRIVLLMSPAAALEILWLIAQLAYSIYSINQVLQQRPAGCLS